MDRSCWIGGRLAGPGCLGGHRRRSLLPCPVCLSADLLSRLSVRPARPARLLVPPVASWRPQSRSAPRREAAALDCRPWRSISRVAYEHRRCRPAGWPSSPGSLDTGTAPTLAASRVSSQKPSLCLDLQRPTRASPPPSRARGVVAGTRRRSPNRSRRARNANQLSAPPQLEPLPAVQPKQCGPVAMRRPSRASRVRSSQTSRSGPGASISSVWLKSQS